MGSYKLDIGFTGVEGAGIVAVLEPDGCSISGLDNCIMCNEIIVAAIVNEFV